MGRALYVPTQSKKKLKKNPSLPVLLRSGTSFSSKYWWTQALFYESQWIGRKFCLLFRRFDGRLSAAPSF